MRVVFHRIELLRVALRVKGAPPEEIEETLSAIQKSAAPEVFDAWNSELSPMERRVMTRMLSAGGESLSGKYLSIFARTFVTRFGLAPMEMERWFKARVWGRN